MNDASHEAPFDLIEPVRNLKRSGVIEFCVNGAGGELEPGTSCTCVKTLRERETFHTKHIVHGDRYRGREGGKGWKGWKG